MPLLINPTNSAFPAWRQAGFNPNHIVSRGMSPGCGLSCIPGPSGAMVNLLNGKIGSPLGTGFIGVVVRPQILSVIGPTNFYEQDSAYELRNAFPGNFSHDPSEITIACIFQSVGPRGLQYPCMFVNTAGGGGGIMTLGTTENTLELFATGDVPSTLVLAPNVPYFMAISAREIGSNAPVNFLLKRLDTGTVVTQFTTAFSIPPGSFFTDGTYLVGNNAFTAGQGANGYIAAVMYSEVFTSMQTLLWWSQDPWSFWYPNPFNDFEVDDFAVGASASPTSLTAVIPIQWNASWRKTRTVAY